MSDDDLIRRKAVLELFDAPFLLGVGDMIRAIPAAPEVQALVRLVEFAKSIFEHCTVTDGVCCCGDDMDGHSEPMSCGHVAVDHGSYAVSGWMKEAEAALKGLAK